MAQHVDRQELAMRYLLGDLSDEEETTLGKQYLSDNKEFEELEIAEEELIDRYVRNELSEKHSVQFEKVLRKSPRLRERVSFAEILAKRVSLAGEPATAPVPVPVSNFPKKKDKKLFSWEGFWGTTTGMSPALRYAFSASVVLMMIASLGLVVLWNRLQAESQKLALEQQQRQQRETDIQREKANNESLQAALEQQRQVNEQQRNSIDELQQQIQEEAAQRTQSQSSFPAFFLGPWRGTRSVGGAKERTLVIPRHASTVDIYLDIQRGEYTSYNASVTDANQREVFKRTNLTPVRRSGGKYIRLKVARKALSNGRYDVRVEGVTASGQVDNFDDYVFRVELR